MSWFTDQARYNKLLNDLAQEEEFEKQSKQLDQIIELLKESHRKIEYQADMIRRLLTMITKMYNDGEINKDTFNKLDDFLKPYYDESNLAQDY